MGRDASVTDQQVYDVADELQRNGEKVSVRAIRRMLGGVGSMGTITKFAQQWREKNGRAAEAGPRALPIKVQRAIFEHTDQEVARAQADLDEELHEARRDLVALADNNEQLTLQLENLHAYVKRLEGDNAVLEGRIAQLLDDLGAVRNETAAERRNAEIGRTELALTKQRLESLVPLEQELLQLRADFETQREARVRAERAAAVLEAERANLAQRLTEMKPNPSRDHGSNGDEPRRRQKGSTERHHTAAEGLLTNEGCNPVPVSADTPTADLESDGAKQMDLC